MQSADQRRALADRFTLVFLKDPRPFSPQWWEHRTRRSLSLFDHGASAFMFELADAKQEYSKMLNCSTKDWPAEQPCHCGAPSPCTMPWLSQNGQRFSLQKAGSCVLKKRLQLELFGKTGTQRNSRQNVVLNESPGKALPDALET